jgi:glycosyltransferase involved in cell wall biosynthesis
MKILFINPYPFDKAPSQRLKFEQYYGLFKKNGFEINEASFMSKHLYNIAHKEGNFFLKGYLILYAYLKRFLLLFTIFKYDIVYIHLWVTPIGPAFFEWIVLKLSKKTIFDIDDLVYTKNSDAKWYINFFKGYNKPIFLIKNCDHVITCTPYLDKFVKQYNKHTTDISSTVDTIERYFPINKYTNEKPIVIGWSGSHSTIKYLLTIKSVLAKIQAKYPQCIFKIMGGNNIAIEGINNLESLDWDNEIEIPTLQTFDIGLYPLPNEQWVHGKSGLKAIQYMALGIPTIATAIGANYRVIDHEKSGFLVSTEDEWVDTISKLIDNPTLRKEIGMNGRKKVEKEFSIHNNVEKYLSIFNKLH